MIKTENGINNDYVQLYGINTPGSKLIKYNDIIVGMIDYNVTDDYVKIHYITVDDKYKRRGIASRVINMIKEKNQNKYMYGNALPGALEFWKSVGAEFDENPNGDCLTPFHIDC
jgi:ribosomal protein S18 acetylase RimI-like enzyme